MSYPVLLPPICDPDDGDYLVDGAFVNNLPADVMLNFGANTIFAVDVGSQNEIDLHNYGDWISGTKHVIRRWIPFVKQQNVLSLTDIQSRLAYVSCVRQLEQVKESGICEYLRPPIEKYQTLQFGAFDEIQEVGYNYALARIEDWKKQHRLKQFTFPANPIVPGKAEQHFTRFNVSSANEEKLRFTDLAEKVTRIEDNTKELVYVESGTDDESYNSSDDDETEVVSDPELFERDFFEDKAASYRRTRGLSADLTNSPGLAAYTFKRYRRRMDASNKALNLTRKRVKFETPVRRRSFDDLQEFSSSV